LPYIENKASKKGKVRRRGSSLFYLLGVGTENIWRKLNFHIKEQRCERDEVRKGGENPDNIPVNRAGQGGKNFSKKKNFGGGNPTEVRKETHHENGQEEGHLGKEKFFHLGEAEVIQKGRDALEDFSKSVGSYSQKNWFEKKS